MNGTMYTGHMDDASRMKVAGWILFPFLVLIPASVAVAQGSERVVVPTNVTFYLPYRDGTPEIRTNLLRATYVVEIRDESGHLLRMGNVETASTKPNPTSDARAYMFRVAERFPEPARYRIVKRFNGVDETNRPVKDTRTWEIVVTHPTLSTPVNVDSIYFFGETAHISFGTVQYPEHPLYEYRIETEQGLIQDSGRGATIDLRAALRDPRNVGHVIVAKGLYNGKTFRFVNPRNSMVEETLWRFRVASPTLSPVSIPWAEPGDRATPVLSFGLSSKYDPTIFSYVYVDTRDTANYVVSTPGIVNVRVQSMPTGFVQSYYARSAGVFSQIVIVPDRQMVGKEGLLVTLYFRFEDGNLGIPYEKRYRAVVFQ
jgi:hypothetical protein